MSFIMAFFYDKSMRKQLEEKIATSECKNFSISAGSAENIEAEDESFDFVISSLVCCSVTNLESALLEIKRVLKPGGRLIFLEHVAAEEGSNRRKWQERINPFWRKLAGNCHLNRETEKAILTAGFKLENVKHENMRKAMPLVRPTIRGTAIKC